MLIINVVNRHETNNIQADIELQKGKFDGDIAVSEVNGPSINSINNSEEQNVDIKTIEKKSQENKVYYEFPAHSFTHIKVKLKRVN